MFNNNVTTCLINETPTQAIEKYYVDLINTINMAASVMSKELPNYNYLRISHWDWLSHLQPVSPI